MPETSGNWLEAVRQVVTAMHGSDVTRLELVRGEFSIRLRREPRVSSIAVALDGQDADLHSVRAPFTGVFYRSPTPTARPYVNEGEWVDADAVIGLVETMKIFNEVVADCSGRIMRLPVQDGQLVHAGDVLAFIEPGDRAPAEADSRVELAT